MSIQMSPFKALYGYEPTSFGSLITPESQVPRARDFIQESMDILRTLKDHIHQAQNQQKIYADHNRTERSFEVGDLVFLRLQPYKQSTLKSSGVEKLQRRFYGPYPISRKVGEVAYELELPLGSRIHNVFHVSRLKKAVGQQISPCKELPPLDDEGKLTLEPEALLDVRERRVKRKNIIEYLILWKGLPEEDATWEGEEIFNHPNLHIT